MAREKSPKQIIRFDGKNVFLEGMNSAFSIGKVQVNFIEYDVNAEKKNRQKKNISMYININKFLLLANDVLSGRFGFLANEARTLAKTKGYKYCKEIYVDMGGMSSKSVTAKKEKDKNFFSFDIPAGKCLSRQLKITPGDRMPWILSAEQGLGEENETGLIVPQGNPLEIVRVPFTDDDFKTFVLVIKTHIEAYLTSQYVAEAMAVTEPNKA